MDFKKLLAKSNGIDIMSHTNDVTGKMDELLPNYSLSPDEVEILKYSAILHDIGKLTTKFQKLLKKNININEDGKIIFPHNIIGWYFIKKYLDHKDKDKIANLVLWHHANYNSCSKLNEDLSKISRDVTPEDITTMKLFCSEYNIAFFDEEDESDVNSYNEFNSIDNLLRSILITADVCASSFRPIEGMFNKSTPNTDNINKDFLETQRTKEQLDIVASIKPNTTTLIKAPAGFGKTMIAVLWTLQSGNKLIWVCPTNVISETVYDSIINELKLLGVNLSVELYLGGERKKSNNTLGDFESDIVITNIDNFIKPSVSNSYGHRCLTIYNADVVFDEVHEYDGMDCALFASFNNIMTKRHNLINSTTLLLTATPTTFRFLNVKGKEMEVLPNKEEHYKSVHQEKYRIHFHDILPHHIMNGEFVFFNNLVAHTQNDFSNYDGDKLISHGRYADEDKDKHKRSVLDNYGKLGIRKPVGVFTNQMLTTSCDYSVNKMLIKSPTIQMFFQSVGRLNRWGGMGVSDVHIVMTKSKSDYVFIGGQNENNLQNLFIEKLRENFEGKATTLDEMYVFYNNFVKENLSAFNIISRDKNEISKNMLKTIYPRKRKGIKGENKVANANLLRKSTTTNEIFIIVKHNNKDEDITLSIGVSDFIGMTKFFDENEHTYKQQIKKLKTLPSYNSYKVLTPEIIRKEAIFYDTPYPVFNHIYDSELGLVRIL